MVGRDGPPGFFGQWGFLSNGEYQQRDTRTTGMSEQQVFEQRGYHVLSMSADVDVFYVDGKMEAFGKRQSNFQRRQFVPSRDSLCTAEPVDSYPQPCSIAINPCQGQVRSAPPHHSLLRTRQGYVYPLSKSKTTGSYFGHEKMTIATIL
jgi:hypothetical protein